MTDQEINKSVANSIGWRFNIREDEEHWWVYRPDGSGFSFNQAVDWAYISSVFQIPDYCHDLNAMHEVETVLPEPEYRMFYYQLHKLRNDDCLPICKCISAPARQRAEAYLRVKGLWQQSTSATTKGM